MKFDYYLENQTKLHPSMQLQDLIKLCYQAAFGPEHMLADVERAKTYFMQEYNATPADASAPLFEPLSDTFCRVNLSAWKAKDLDADTLFELFVASAGNSTAGTETDFDLCIKDVEEIITKGLLSFSLEEWKQYYAAYKENGIHPVHHSDAYRQAEQPAYRLVRRNLLPADIA